MRGCIYGLTRRHKNFVCIFVCVCKIGLLSESVLFANASPLRLAESELMPAGQCKVQLFLQLSLLMLPSVLGNLSSQPDTAGASEVRPRLVTSADVDASSMPSVQDVSSRVPEDCDVGECSTQEHHETQVRRTLSLIAFVIGPLRVPY